MASTVEIVPRADTDLAQLFAFASAVFAGQPGWRDERVLEVLRGDVVFVARERGQLAGAAALRAPVGRRRTSPGASRLPDRVARCDQHGALLETVGCRSGYVPSGVIVLVAQEIGEVECVVAVDAGSVLEREDDRGHSEERNCG